MSGKRGWQSGIVFALILIQFLSGLAVWQEIGRWRVLDQWSLASRYVGNAPNQKCCVQAAAVVCNPCLNSPTCTPNATSTGYCADSTGQKTSSAWCSTINKQLFCDTSVLVAGTTTVFQCVLTGKTQACQGGLVQCQIDPKQTQQVQIPYTGCNAQVDACAGQPALACLQNP